MLNKPSLVSIVGPGDSGKGTKINVPLGQSSDWMVPITINHTDSNAYVIVDKQENSYRVRGVLTRSGSLIPYEHCEVEFNRNFTDLPECVQSKLLIFEACGNHSREGDGLGVTYFLSSHPKPMTYTYVVELYGEDDFAEIHKATGVQP